MNEAYTISPKSMFMRTFNIINLLLCLFSRTNNVLEDLDGGLGIIYFLMEISHTPLKKMIQILPARSINTPISQPQHTFAYPHKDIKMIQQLTTTPK